MSPAPRPCRVGFTLIELLVVVSLIALLIGILLPALAGARHAARISACLSNARQLAIGVHAYSAENKDAIPRGIDSPSIVPTSWGEMNVLENSFASSAIWRGGGPIAGLPHISEYNSHGKLLDGYLTDKRSMFCPDDDTTDPTQELAKIGVADLEGIGAIPPYAFSSYLYRNLDQTTRDLVHDLGRNDLNQPATALLWDSNSTGDPLGSPGTIRTNHRNEMVNVSYSDGHGQTLSNQNGGYSLQPTDYYFWSAGIAAAYDAMLQRADAKEPG